MTAKTPKKSPNLYQSAHSKIQKPTKKTQRDTKREIEWAKKKLPQFNMLQFKEDDKKCNDIK